MTREIAAQWVRAVVPSWIYRWLMPAAWVGAVAVSIASEGRCTVEAPCGPDLAYSLTMILCFASLVLLWWQPIMATAAGVLFLVAEVRYEDVETTRTAWILYGVVCAALLGWLLVSRRNQRALVAGVPRRPVSIPAAAQIGVTSRVLLASALVVVGVAALFVMRWQDQREDAHLQRAVEQTAVVERLTDDGDVVLKLPDGRTHTTTLVDDYEVGASLPVLVDPADADWLRPRAEPADYTFWYTGAGGVWVLALLLALRDLQMRRARPRRSWTGQGLPVQIVPTASEAFAVRSADNAVLLGFIDLDLDDEDRDLQLAEAFEALSDEAVEAPARLRREWEETLSKYQGEALLVGELAEGSWPTIVLGEEAMRPVAPFRAPRRVLWRTESVDGLDGDLADEELDDDDLSDEELDDETEVVAAQVLPGLPWAVPLRARAWWELPAWIAALVLTPAAAFVLPQWLDDRFAGIAAAVLGLQAVHFVGSQIFFRVTATADMVWVRSGWFDRSTAWRSVQAIDVTEDRLDLQTSDDDWFVVAGIAPGRLEEAAGVFEALRLRSNTGLPVESDSRRVSPVLLVDALVVVVCAAALLLT